MNKVYCRTTVDTFVNRSQMFIAKHSRILVSLMTLN